MKKNIVIAFVIILLIVATFASGTGYWLFMKAKNISRSATNISGATTTAPNEDLNTSLEMPSEDSTGQDLENVVRYPGSIRTHYYVSDDKKFTSVEYIAPASAETVNDYYKNYLQSMNWTLVSSDQKTTNYTSEGYDLTVEIISKSNSPLLVKYALNLTKVAF